MLKRMCVLMAAVSAAAMAAVGQVASITAGGGWDIYKAGVYRYGPSFITYGDGTIDAWFAAPGQDYEDCALHLESGSTPIQVASKGYVAQYFEVDRPFFGVSVLSPTWSKNGTESVRISLYKWDKNISTTKAGTPLGQAICEKYNDNDPVTVKSATGEQLPAGQYLAVLDQASEFAGVYVFNEPNPALNGSVYLGTILKKKGSLRGQIIYDNNNITAYWDQVSYQRSSDGGRTWTPEKMVLKPTRNTRDQYSICDPGVAFWNGYYYAGYTSTEHSGGLENHLYVARSKNPDGPWEKWNGAGWGGTEVEPVVEFTQKGSWGIGEPSFVIKDNTVYLYYTYDAGLPTTRVATAHAGNENWPAMLEQHGTVITKQGGSDHCDVKYVDAAKRFLAVNTVKRMTKDAYIEAWQSEDGITFERIGKIEGILYPSGLHNCGINGDEQGHIDISKPQHIAFAYGIDDAGQSLWACWSTYLQPITIVCSASGIESVEAASDSPLRMFNMQGMEVDPQTASPGLYIRLQGGKTKKIAK